MSVTKKKVPLAITGAKIATLIDHGRKEITTKEELEKYPIGSLISYMNNKNVYKIGGFLLKVVEEYFIYLDLDFQTKYRVRYGNVEKMWVGDVHKVNNDIVSIAKTKQEKTNFPVKIGKTIVYYAVNRFDLNRFVNTKKYQNMAKWYEYFENK